MEWLGDAKFDVCRALEWLGDAKFDVSRALEWLGDAEFDVSRALEWLGNAVRSDEKQTNWGESFASLGQPEFPLFGTVHPVKPDLGGNASQTEETVQQASEAMKVQVNYFYFPWVRLRFQPEGPSETETLQENAVHS